MTCRSSIVGILAAVAVVASSGCDPAPSATTSSSASSAQAAKAPPPLVAWLDFSLDDAGLTVSLPDRPRCQDQGAGSGARIRVCGAESDKTGMMINVSELAQTIAPDRIAAELDATMNRAASGMNAQVTESREVAIGALKAREFTFNGERGVIRGRLVIKDSHLVLIMATAKGDADDTTRAESERFLASLR